MRKNLLEFLFGGAAAKTDPGDLGENIVRMFEEADKIEGEQMVANKKPLADALKAIGVSGEVKNFPQWCEIHFDNGDDYREAANLLGSADNIHKLAELGWVAARSGDLAQMNEPPDYKIGFIEIQTAEGGDSEKLPDLEKIRKDAAKFATTPLDRDDEMNPVETKDKVEMGDKTTGVGKPKEGSDPEGKPKGSSKNESLRSSQIVERMLDAEDLGSSHTHDAYFRTTRRPKKDGKTVHETTTTTGIPPVESPMGIQPSRPDWSERLKRMKKRRGEKMARADEIISALLETDADDVDIKHFIDTIHRENKSGKITPQAAMTANHFYHRTLRYKSRDVPVKARRNGSTKTWKTRPGQFRVPIKVGMYEYGYIDNRNADEWSTIPDPPPEPAK
jgi:hypothetical protein